MFDNTSGRISTTADDKMSGVVDFDDNLATVPMSDGATLLPEFVYADPGLDDFQPMLGGTTDLTDIGLSLGSLMDVCPEWDQAKMEAGGVPVHALIPLDLDDKNLGPDAFESIANSPHQHTTIAGDMAGCENCPSNSDFLDTRGQPRVHYTDAFRRTSSTSSSTLASPSLSLASSMTPISAGNLGLYPNQRDVPPMVGSSFPSVAFLNIPSSAPSSSSSSQAPLAAAAATAAVATASSSSALASSASSSSANTNRLTNTEYNAAADAAGARYGHGSEFSNIYAIVSANPKPLDMEFFRQLSDAVNADSNEFGTLSKYWRTQSAKDLLSPCLVKLLSDSRKRKRDREQKQASRRGAGAAPRQRVTTSPAKGKKMPKAKKSANSKGGSCSGNKRLGGGPKRPHPDQSL